MNYLKKYKIWFRLYSDRTYDVKVSAEDRAQAVHENRSHGGQLNPPRAWESCASFVQAWDWDSLRRGPSCKSSYELKRTGDTAPYGKGWIIDKQGNKRRVAGECANPMMLSYISCPTWCTKYQPTNVAGVVYVLQQIQVEHELRALAIAREIESLQRAEKTFEQAIATGSVYFQEHETR